MLHRLDALDALVALATAGTVSEAATRLRLTQSAVSKRLASLEAELGFRLCEPEGRRLRLTPAARGFLERAQPLVAELRGLVRPAPPDAPPALSIALADSIASSWGPAVVRGALDRLPGAEIELHAHRSVLVIESVRLGRYDVGLCTASAAARDLVQHPLVDEPMALVRGTAPRGRSPTASIVTIEPTSATWRAIEADLRARHPALAARSIVAVESFAAALQMASAGFGDAIVPWGLAQDLSGGRRMILPGVTRRIALYTRKSLAQEAGFARLYDALARGAQRAFLRGRPRRRGASLRSKSRSSEKRSSSMSSTDV
jgi:DNA-binding transcriptional LysR family regulator